MKGGWYQKIKVIVSVVVPKPKKGTEMGKRIKNYITGAILARTILTEKSSWTPLFYYIHVSRLLIGIILGIIIGLLASWQLF